MGERIVTAWPRAMKRATAAAYCDMSVASFDREVATVRHELRFDGWLGMLAHSGDVLLFAFNWWLLGKVGRWIDAA